MINIKEAGRYANFIQGKINALMNFLDDEDVYMTTHETHFKSKALKSEEDEEIKEELNKELDLTVEDAVFLIKELIDKKMELSTSINYAKASLYVDWVEKENKLPLDTAIEYAKNLRSFALTNLEKLSNSKGKEYTTRGVSQLINKEGNQNDYCYEIKVVKKINYDRNIAKKQCKNLLNKADLLSEEIDKAMLKKIIDFDTTYCVHDSLEDIAEAFKNKI